MRPRADHPILDGPLTHVIARIVSLRHLEKPQPLTSAKDRALHFSTAVQDGRFVEAKLPDTGALVRRIFPVRRLAVPSSRRSPSCSVHRPRPANTLAIVGAGPVTGCHVRAMRTAMSSAGWGASAASRVSQAWLTGIVVLVWRVRARRAIPVSRSAAGLSMSPSVYRTRVLWRGGGARGGWWGPPPPAPGPRGRPGGGWGKAGGGPGARPRGRGGPARR